MFSLNVETGAFTPERIKGTPAKQVEFELKFDPRPVIAEFGDEVWRSYCGRQVTGGVARAIEKFLEVDLSDLHRAELYENLDALQEFVVSRNRRDYSLTVAPESRQVHNL